MTVSFYLSRPASKTRTAIYARIYYGSYEMKYLIGLSINPKYWNSKTHSARLNRDFPNAQVFNANLNNISNLIQGCILQYKLDHKNLLPEKDELKRLLDTQIKGYCEPVRDRLTDFIEQYIQDSKNGIRRSANGKPITAGTIKTYKATKAVMIKFEAHRKRPIRFEDIGLLFYAEFTTYLTVELEHKPNYIGKHIKTIKSVMQYAVDLGLTDNQGHRKRGFTTVTEEVDNIYLNEAELAELAKIDLSERHHKHVRDMFIIGCYTGLRHSDLGQLKPEHIQDGLISIKPIKTKDKVIKIPVHAEVVRIMAEYGGKLPHAYENQPFNKWIKEVCGRCELLKKTETHTYTKGGVNKTETIQRSELVSTHTARMSFATNNYLAGVPVLSIMAITGHRTERSFLKYIKVTASEHAKIMAKVWGK